MIDDIFSNTKSTFDTLHELPISNYCNSVVRMSGLIIFELALKIGDVISIKDPARKQLIQNTHIKVDEFDRFINREPLDIRIVIFI